MRLLTLILGCHLAAVAWAGDDVSLMSRKLSEATPLVEGPNDSNIVRLTSEILRRQHFLKLPFDRDLSSKFLERFLDAMDPQHIFFIQTDLDEFEQYRHQLHVLTLEKGDTSVAREIFLRFRERLEQQHDYVFDLLKANSFRFDGDDCYVVNRKKEKRPPDLAWAKRLWFDRLRYEYLQERLAKEKPDDIIKKLTRRYNNLLRAIREYDEDDVVQLYLTSLARVFDPHSDYMGKSELDNFSIGMKLSLYGIGALLRSEDGICKIVSLTPGGPAERSRKLKANDQIIAVAQSNTAPVDVVDMKLSKVVELIRGPKDTEVRLTVIPADASDSSVRKEIRLIRDEIKLEEQAAKARLYEIPTGTNHTSRLGVIELPSFYSAFELEGKQSGSDQKSTTIDVARLITKLKKEGCEGIVLDLRRNGGGSLEEAITLAGLFIKEGPIVQVKDSEGRVFVDNDPESSIFYDGPLMVITSRFSASASEIVAGALQDYGRAIIVGDSTTHGKGTVQSLLQLSRFFRSLGILTDKDPGALKITIRKFYRVSGGSTQKEGITPDIVLPSVNDTIEVGEAFLDNPLPWDTIPAAAYDRFDLVAPHLSELRRLSGRRIAVDRDFSFVREEIRRYEKQQAEKCVSLNEAVRLKEKQDADERAQARKQELAVRPEAPGKVYEIKLKDVDLPGLPPPIVKTNQVSKADGLDLPPGNIVVANEPQRTADDSSKVADEDRSQSEEDASESPTPPDITLEEAKRIMIDYVNLLSRDADWIAVRRLKNQN
jgi:carboxyl-terminal processing protease